MKSSAIFDSTGYRLARAAKDHRGRLARCLAPVGLYLGQELLLATLWQENGLTQSQLSEQLGIGAPTVTKIVKGLEHIGLITRARDTKDARVSRVWLTERGVALQPEIERCWLEAEARMVRALNKQEEGALRSLLEKTAETDILTDIDLSF